MIFIKEGNGRGYSKSSILISTLLYYYFHENKRLLNIITFPFHLLGAFSFIEILKLSVYFQFPENSFWHCEKGEYTPFFIRARTFLAKPIGILILIMYSFSFLVDWKTGVYSNLGYRIWIINNIIIIFSGFLVPALIIRKIIFKFDEIIDSLKDHFLREEYFNEFKKFSRNKLVSRNEIIPALIMTSIVRLGEIAFPYSTWGAWGDPIFPLTPIWWSFSVESFWMGVHIVIGSFLYFFYRFGRMLIDISKNKNIYIYIYKFISP